MQYIAISVVMTLKYTRNKTLYCQTIPRSLVPTEISFLCWIRYSCCTVHLVYFVIIRDFKADVFHHVWMSIISSAKLLWKEGGSILFILMQTSH